MSRAQARLCVRDARAPKGREPAKPFMGEGEGEGEPRLRAALRAGRPRSRADCRARPANSITRGAMLWIPAKAGMTG